MSEIVARIIWDAFDSESGDRAEGVRLVMLDEVSIVERHVSAWEKDLNERLARMRKRLPRLLQTFLTTRKLKAGKLSSEIAETWYQKCIQLSDRYHVGYSEHPRPNNRGFGLHAGLGPITTEGCHRTFSWDWFTIAGPGEAQKLQESGLIRFESAETPCGPEIGQMRFESDVSLRIFEPPNIRVTEPKWRVNLRAGTEIRWPSLIDGVVVANGYIEA